jgi:RimJ/RimL family protein N-acetyltransferase
MKYYKKLIGKKCYLSPINIEDADKYSEWLSDIEVGIGLGIYTTQLSLPKEEKILQQMIDKNEYIFGIINKENDVLIGNCGLHNVNNIDGRAEFGIFIGDKSNWGKGFGKDATRLILDFGFNILNLHEIYLQVFEYNPAAIKLYEQVGFKKAGTFREAKIIGGRKFDIIIMDILAEEYSSVFIQDKILKQN